MSNSHDDDRFITITLDREDMRRRGRLGGLATRASHDPAEMTAPARRAFTKRLEEQVDPSGTLPPEERRARAEALRRAHLVRIARISADKRRKAKPLPDTTPHPA